MKLMSSYLKEVNLLLEKVISGTDLTPNMAQNVLDITLTDDLKKNVKNFLDNFLKLYFPKIGGNFLPKSGTIFAGPYSCGKSHLSLFLAFLFGYKQEEFPEMREKCWKRLEKFFSKKDLEYYKPLRDPSHKFLVIFNVLSLEIERPDLYVVILKSIENALKEKKINIEFDTQIEESLKKKFEDLKSIIKDQHSDISLELIPKNYLEVAQKIKKILEENDLKGIILFFDEFLRYYNDIGTNMKEHTGTVLQNFAKDTQKELKMGIILVSQKGLINSDDNFKQVRDRFTTRAISFTNAGKIIQNRVLPTINESDLRSLYNMSMVRSDNHKRRLIELKDFLQYYPFHPKTIWAIEKFIGFYSNALRGMIHYSTNTFENIMKSNRPADKLILASTLFDFFTSDCLESSKEHHLKERFEYTYNNYISTIGDQKRISLSEDILKILLFCSNERYKWHYKDFGEHFYDDPDELIDNCIDNLLKFIKKNDSDYISRSSDGHFWYNPGRKGDLSKYLEQFQDLIEIEKASNHFWNSQICKILRVNEIGKFASRNFQWKKILDTYFSLVATNKENFKETLNQSVEILNSIPQPNLIKNYRNIDDIDIHDGIIIIAHPTFLSPQDINKLVDDVIYFEDSADYCHSVFKNNPEIFKKSIMIISSQEFNQKDKNLVLLHYSMEIFLEMTKNINRIDWGAKLRELQSITFMDLIEEIDINKLEDIFNQIKHEENHQSVLNYIKEIEVEFKELSGEIKKKIIQKIVNGKFLALNNYISWNNFQDLGLDKPNDLNGLLEYFANKLLPEKYPKLFYMKEGKSQRLFKNIIAPQGTKIFNLVSERLIGINKNKYEDIKIHDNTALKFCGDSLVPLNLLVKNSRRNFSFNLEIDKNPGNFKEIFEIIQQNEEPIQLNTLLIEYLMPPYGYSKIVTLLMILSLVHIEKLELVQISESKSKAIEIYKYLKKEGDISPIDAIENLIPLDNLYIVKPDILEREKFEMIYSFLEILLQTKKTEKEDYEVNKSNYLFPQQICLEYYTIFHKRPSLTFDLQNQLYKIIRSLDFFNLIEEIKEETSDFYKFVLVYMKSEEEVKNSFLDKIINFRNINFFDLISKIIIDFPNEIRSEKIRFNLEQFIDNVLKSFNIENKRNWNLFLTDFSYFWKNIDKLRAKIDNDKDSKKIFIEIRDSLVLLQREDKYDFIQVENNNYKLIRYKKEIINSIKNKIFSILESYILNEDEFIGFLFCENTDENVLISNLKIFFDQFFIKYWIFHEEFWSFIKKLKENIFENLNDFIERTKFLNFLSELSEKYFYIGENEFKNSIKVCIITLDDFKEREIKKKFFCPNCPHELKIDNEYDLDFNNTSFSLPLINLDDKEETILDAESIKLEIYKNILVLIDNEINREISVFKKDQKLYDVIIDNFLKNVRELGENYDVFNALLRKGQKIPSSEQLLTLFKESNEKGVIKKRDLIVISIDFLRRISKLFNHVNELDFEILKEINDLLTNEEISKYLRIIFKENLSEYEKILLEFDIFEWKEIVTINSNVNHLNTDFLNRVTQKIKSINSKFGNRLLLIGEEVQEEKNITERFQEALLKLNKDVENEKDSIERKRLSNDINQIEKIKFFNFKQKSQIPIDKLIIKNKNFIDSLSLIRISKEKYKDYLIPALRTIFNFGIFFGSTEEAISFFERNLDLIQELIIITDHNKENAIELFNFGQTVQRK